MILGVGLLVVVGDLLVISHGDVSVFDFCCLERDVLVTTGDGDVVCCFRLYVVVGVDV